MNSTTNTVLPETSFTLSFTVRNSGLLFCYTAEEKPLLDQNLEKNWGKPSLWRLMLTRRVCAGEDEWTLEYKKYRS